jgi:hypothetical protein
MARTSDSAVGRGAKYNAPQNALVMEEETPLVTVADVLAVVMLGTTAHQSNIRGRLYVTSA